jgi:cell division protein FtsW
VCLLCGLGVVMVYSASSVAAVERSGSSWTIAARQTGWLLAGTALAVAAARTRLATWRDRIAGPFLLVTMGGLLWLALDVAVTKVGGHGLPFAVEVNGATRWIGWGPAQFQPSELAKPALVLWTARLLSERRRDLGTWEGIRPVVIAFGSLCALVIAGDDLGTTLLLGVVVLSMLLLAGAPARWILGLGGGLVTVGLGVLFFFERFRLQRVAAFLSPDAHAGEAGYQVLQARIGLASGGLFGSGPGYSRAKWGFLPEAHTDFILAVIGEELGLVGTLVVLGLFVTFAACGCLIALRCGDPFGRLVAFGVTTWLAVQAFINIGVAVGTLPTKGITLPFVSYGGSSLLVSLLGVGMLLSVARAR